MKKHATTIVLVLVAGLLAVWLWIDKDRVTEGERRGRENNVFTAWRREELSRIELGHAGGEDAETIVLERDVKGDTPWRMTAPRQERADQQAVERLLQTFELAIVQRKATEGGALGFETPRAFGSVKMGGLVYRFVLGAESPRPEGSSYFRVNDEPPIVVSRDFTKTLLASSDTYRDRTVVPYLSLELAELSVTYEGGGLTLEHITGRFFRVAQEGVAASRAGADRVWSALAELRAEAFPKEADVDKLTAKPVLTMRLVPSDGRPPAEIVFGDACPGHPDDVVVLRKKPTRVAACAPRGVVDTLRVAPAQLIERRPFFLDADEIEEIRFERAGSGRGPEKVDLARKGTGWRSRTQDRDLAPDEADAVSELVSKIAASPAPVIKRDHKLKELDVVARAIVRAGEHEEKVEVGAPNAEGVVPVRRLFDMARLEVSPALARRLMPRETITRSRALLEEPRRVTRIVLRCGTPQELVDKGEGLKLVEPSGFETDGAVVSLAEAFAKGKVERWVADEDDGSFGLAKSTCRVVLGFEDGNNPKTIVLGAEGEGGVYGAIEGRPGVFLAPLALRDLASTIYVSRAALRPEPSLVSRVRVVKAKTTPSPEAAREALAGLYAESVLAVGKDALRAVGTPDVELEVSVADAGAPRLVRCAPTSPPPGGFGARHACTTTGVLAAFAVPDARLAPFLGTSGAEKSDGGAGPADAGVARDAGSR